MQQRIVILDGAMGTLMAGGISATEAHRQYLLAGADIITANTLVPSTLAFSPSTAEAIEQSIKTAIDARDTFGVGRWVAASIGPSSLTNDPLATVRSYCQIMRLMLDCGADFLLLETFHNFKALELALEALDKIGNVPFMASVTTERQGRMASGEHLAQVFELAQALSPIAVGLNCCNGSESILELATLAAQSTSKPLIICPSAGMPNEHGIYPDTPSIFANRMAQVVKLLPQVRIVGGCCGTTPAHISALTKLCNR